MDDRGGQERIGQSRRLIPSFIFFAGFINLPNNKLMNTLVCNTSSPKVNMSGESVALRAAYYLSDMAVSFGTTHMVIHLEAHYQHVKGEKNKLEMMRKYYTDKNDGGFQDMEKIFKHMLVARQKKHKSKEDIIFIKRAERLVDTYYQAYVDFVLKMSSPGGLNYLAGVMEKNKFEFIPTDVRNTETEKEPYYPASKFLQRQWEKELTPPVMFCLTQEFFTKDFLPRHPILAPGDWGVKDAANPYVDHCFTFPNLNGMNTEELLTVRKDTEKVSGDFKKAVDEWITMADHGAPGADTLKFYLDKVKPLTLPLQKHFEENDILRDMEKKYPGASVEVHLGEAPMWFIRDFYETLDVFTSETWQKMNALKDTKGDERNRRYPFMCIRGVVSEAPPPAETKTQEVVKTKKYIDLD